MEVSSAGQSTWISLQKDTYENICSGIPPTEEWEVLRECSILTPSIVDNNTKLFIIQHLFYQAIRYCAYQKVRYAGVSALLEAIQEQLFVLFRQPSEYLHFSDQDFSKEYLERFLTKFEHRDGSADEEVFAKEVKILSKFYAKQFIQYLDAYQYILQCLPIEHTEQKYVETQSPMISMPIDGLDALPVVSGHYNDPEQR